MRPESHVSLTPRMEEAVHELKGMITKRFPQAAFVVEEGADPKGIWSLARNSNPLNLKGLECLNSFPGLVVSWDHRRGVDK